MSSAPDDPRAPAPPARRLLAGIFFLALALRLLALAELAGSPWIRIPLGDARFFDEWGLSIAGGRDGQEAFFQAPLYAYLLGGLYALCGHAPLLVRVLQGVLGALACAGIAAATGRLAGRRAGLAAGCLAALSPAAIRYDLELEKTSAAFVLCAALLWITVAAEEWRSAPRALVAGLLLGALALLRENMAVLIVPLAWALGRGERLAWRAPAWMAAGFVLALTPSTLHNWRAGAPLAPTGSNAGVNFYIGNAAEADGLYRPLVAGRGHPDHEREDAWRIASELAGRDLSPSEVSRFWFGLALEEIAQEPGHFAAVLARKARLLVHHDEVMDATAFEVYADGSLVLRVLGLLSFGVLLPLAAAGMVLAWRLTAARPVLLGVLLLGASIVAFFVVGRFRVAALPFVLPFAGIAVAEARTVLRRRGALAACAGTLVLCWWPLESPGDPRATSASNLASELLRRERPEEAEPWARRARELDPGSAGAAFNLGLVLRHLDRPAEAEEHFRDAMRLEPAFSADCLAELGAARALQGDPAGARELLTRALELEPSHPSALRFLRDLER